VPGSVGDRIADMDVIGHREISITAGRLPMVGLHPAAGAGVRPLLEREGFAVRTDLDPDRYGAYVHETADVSDPRGLVASVVAQDGPLLRIWRWPDRAVSTLSVSGDVDALTILDFGYRLAGR
jgi:hypothetical protein